MSMLERVQKMLQENANVTIVGVMESNFLPGKTEGSWSHIREIFVTPSTTGMYDAEELQSFMTSLLLEVEPTLMDPFTSSDDGMAFGKLYFDEVIGTEKLHREISIAVTDFQLPEDFVNSSLIVDRTEEIWRRTIVRVFPSKLIASAAADNNISRSGISIDELWHLRELSR